MFFNEITLIFASSVTLLTICLACLYFKNRDNENFLYAVLFFVCCSLALYSEYHIELNSGHAQAIFWSKISYIAIFGFIYTFPAFTAILTGKALRKRTKNLLGIITLVCFAFIGLTDLIASNQPVTYLNVLQVEIGTLFPLFIALLLIITCGYYVKAVLMRKSLPEQSRQTPLIIGVALGFLLSSLDAAGVFIGRPLIPGFRSCATYC
jgi:4-amino-4-deoxy-L-arabinose transferase-like glycosyltransferase